MTADSEIQAQEQPTRHGNSSQHSWREAVWLCVFLMMGLVVMSRSKADPDLWGHVTYGKEVIRDGHLHEFTTWSYAIDNFRWVNHENIAELMMAAADMIGGQAALLLMKSVLTLLLLGLPLLVARRNGAGLLTCFVLTALVSFTISFHWLLRPHMLSYVSGAALMAILAQWLPGVVMSRPAELKFSRWLWLIPPLMCFWTNSHGGYLAGMAILTAWLGLDGIELLLKRDKRLWPTVRHHALLFAASVAACFVNPYGLELHTWMLSSLGRPRPEISEWAPLPLWTMDGLPFWILAFVTLLSLKKSRAEIRWPAMIVMVLLSWQAVKHYRHLPFVALMASYILVPHLESLWQRFRQSAATVKAEHTAGSRKSLIPAAACLALLIVAQYPRQARLQVDRGFYPVAAMQYMADHRLDGKVFVTFNWAQYALAVFSDSSPDSRIAFDGRFRTCYPQPVIDMYFDFILGEQPSSKRYREDASGPFDPVKSLQYRDPDLVLFERRRKSAVAVMESQKSDWCLLYQDSLAQLWGRRHTFDDPSSPRFIPVGQRCVTDDLQIGTVDWPAFPKRIASASKVATHSAVRR